MPKKIVFNNLIRKATSKLLFLGNNFLFFLKIPRFALALAVKNRQNIKQKKDFRKT